ncbi:MAG: PDR/VanB family oxidoreductase [Rubrivivax sp.]
MPQDPASLSLRVTRAEMIARDIRLFELCAPDGTELPPFTAGAHLRMLTPSGDQRHYSLCNDPAERTRYCIAVKREAMGRGGSRSLVDGVQAGDLLQVGAPENQFVLDPRARGFLLVAGGIGLTPLKAMAHALRAEGTRRFRLVVLARDAASTPFLDDLRGPELAPHVTLHHDGGDPARSFDLWPLLEKPGSATGLHVYCCGPKPLMDTVRDMTGHWSSAAVHFETFGADTAPRPEDTAFDVHLARRGLQFSVPPGRSLLQVLRANGVTLPSSCESGTCGSCRTGLLGGEADHRDLVLLDEEKATQIMPCVSRARSGPLVLDL